MRKLIISLSSFIMSFATGMVIALFLIPERPIPPSEVQIEHINTSSQPSANEPQAPANPATYEWEENFSNATDIGRRRKNKVEVRCVSRNDEIFAEIEFFSLSKTREWTRKQALKFDDLNYVACDANITDFNNDGFNDLTFISGQAARGANELRPLLIYNPKTDELIHIKNSDEFPNLSYNKKLDCVDAWAVHGTTTTIFLRLEGDTLREFASVDTGVERIVTITRKNGEKVVIRREPMNEDEIYTRYSTYNPPG